MQANIQDTQLPPQGGFGPITQTHIVRFAGAGGDFNPLHHDVGTAQNAGFDRPIAMGQFVAALMSGWISDWCGIENLRHFEVSFRAPVYVGDTLSFTATAERSNEEHMSREDAVQLELTAHAGERLVATGKAAVRER